eukprot:768790-Hanusia_phi.AAC.6
MLIHVHLYSYAHTKHQEVAASARQTQGSLAQLHCRHNQRDGLSRERGAHSYLLAASRPGAAVTVSAAYYEGLRTKTISGDINDKTIELLATVTPVPGTDPVLTRGCGMAGYRTFGSTSKFDVSVN